jgi:hypothetical protein
MLTLKTITIFITETKTYFLKMEKDPTVISLYVSSRLCLRPAGNLKSDTAVTNHPHTGFKASISSLLGCDALISYCSFCPSRAYKIKIPKKTFQSAQLVAFYTHESLLGFFHLELYRISSTKSSRYEVIEKLDTRSYLKPETDIEKKACVEVQ